MASAIVFTPPSSHLLAHFLQHPASSKNGLKGSWNQPLPLLADVVSRLGDPAIGTTGAEDGLRGDVVNGHNGGIHGGKIDLRDILMDPLGRLKDQSTFIRN